MSQYVDGSYAARHETYHVEDSAWKTDQIVSILRKNNVSPESVVDVGCGAGEILRLLQAQLPPGTQLTGYDISPQAIDLAQPRANEYLRFLCADMLQDETVRADLSLAIDVFEHIEDYMAFLRHLLPKASFHIFHIPLDLSVQILLRSTPILTERKQLGHLHYFWKDTALATLSDTGYQIVDWTYTYWGEYFAGRSMKSKLAQLPRNLLRAFNQDFAVRVLGCASLLVLARGAEQSGQSRTPG